MSNTNIDVEPIGSFAWDGIRRVEGYNLLFKTEFDCIECLALSEQGLGEELQVGLAHSVCPIDLAFELEERSVIPCEDWKDCFLLDMFLQVEIINPITSVVEPLKCWLLVAPRVWPDEQVAHGGHHFHDESKLKKCVVVYTHAMMEAARRERVDVIAILGSVEEGSPFLLSSKWLVKNIPDHMKDQGSCTLLHMLMNRLPKEGYAIERRGGSAGEAKINFELLSFLKNCRACVPRGADSAVWVPKHNKWWVFYVSPYTGEAVSQDYSQPVKGGQFMIDGAIAQVAGEFLYNFMWCKIMTPGLLRAIHQLCLEQCPQLQLSLPVPDSIRAQEHLTSVNLCAAQEDGDEDLFHSVISRLLLAHSSTLLLTPMQCHLDTLKTQPPPHVAEIKKKNQNIPLSLPLSDVNKNAFIETLAFFSFKSCPQNNYKHGAAYGRGGAGRERMVWGWVDHPWVNEAVLPGYVPQGLRDLIDHIRNGLPQGTTRAEANAIIAEILDGRDD